MKRIVLAYSGGPSSSLTLAWLRRQADVEVVTVTVDIGQGPDLAAVRERALALGAVRAHVLEAREQFGREFVLPALQAGAFGVDVGVGAALAHVLIATRTVEMARMESASAASHGSRPGSAAGQLLNATIAQLDQALEVVLPSLGERAADDDWLGAARSAGIHVPSADELAVNANLWGRTISLHRGEPGEEAYVLTRSPHEAPLSPAWLDIEFHDGVPVSANGVEMSLLELVESIETIAGAHGVGRYRSPDAECIIEAPAAIVLATAHAALERGTLGDDLANLKRLMAVLYVRHAREGRWFSDAKAAIAAFVAVAEKRVTGTVRLQLLQGQCSVVEHRSPHDVTAPGVRVPTAVA
jgi:argininosuccinate synthase